MKTTLSTRSTAGQDTLLAADNGQAFAAWAAVYDRLQNPLLTLEERFMRRMLPRIDGAEVLDLGCGTGRWLSVLSERHPAFLHGIDASAEMLSKASEKGLPRTRLTQGRIPPLPAGRQSADIALASFVLSYVQNLDLLASELARVLRPGGTALLSDMHPQTARTLGWRRAFEGKQGRHELRTEPHSLAQIIRAFAAHGLLLTARLEPAFGEPERAQFRHAGKEAEWHKATGLPAIYLLQFERLKLDARNSFDAPAAGLTCVGAACALGANEVLPAAVATQRSRIRSMLPSTGSESHTEKSLEIDLSGYMLFPGLINAHDHLEFALFPRLGRPPYSNATAWAQDIHVHEAGTIALHKRVPKKVRLQWGAIRNLLCGVTTVCHHNPLDPILADPALPIRCVTRFGWAHSPAFDDSIAAAYAQTAVDAPFLIHACEGVDASAAAELQQLDALGVLTEKTALIHGLALEQAGVARLNERQTALLVCPSSNAFLFGTTHRPELLRSVARTAVGSDSPLTAAGDYLDELRYAQAAFRLSAAEAYAMAMDSSAQILRLQNGEGRLHPGAFADMFAVRQRAGSACDILGASSWRDVELVMVGGRVNLASAQVYRRLPLAVRANLHPLMVDDQLRWLRAPVSELLDAAEQVLGDVRLGQLQINRAQV